MEVVECLELLLQSAPRLLTAQLHGNPFCKGPVQPGGQRYRDAIILMSDGLATLDGEDITAQQRSFLLRFHIQKLKVGQGRNGGRYCPFTAADSPGPFQERVQLSC